jgi:hypothetical protein
VTGSRPVPDLPPFHTLGRDADEESDDVQRDRPGDEQLAHFFALASMPGVYSTRPEYSIPAILGLYFSTSPGFTPFSVSCYGREQLNQLWYHRGDDHFPSLEATLHSLASREEIPTFAWTLYPASHIGEDGWPDAATRDAYMAARQRLSLFLFKERIVASARISFPAKPLFTAAPDVAVPNAEYAWPDDTELSAEAVKEMERLEGE